MKLFLPFIFASGAAQNGNFFRDLDSAEAQQVTGPFSPGAKTRPDQIARPVYRRTDFYVHAQLIDMVDDLINKALTPYQTAPLNRTKDELKKKLYTLF